MRSVSKIVGAALVACLAVQGAFAQSAVTLAPAKGHPLLPVTVSGTGFGNSEAVDVFFDTTDTLLVVSSATGTLSGSVTVPASAQPGPHFITAIGRRSGNAAQVTFSVTTPWLKFGFGVADQAFNPYENTINTGNVWSLGTLWSFAGPGGGGTPAIAAGRVIVGGFPGLQALSTVTGKSLWSKVSGEQFEASPAIVGNVVYAGSDQGQIYALNVATGATIWSTGFGTPLYSSPTVVGNVVYIGGWNGTVYALQTSTGAVVWTFATGGSIDSSPAVVNGIVYIGSYDKKLYALNATTGAVLWSYTTGSLVESSPIVANGVVYFGSNDTKVYALRAGPAGGSVIWSYATGGAVYSALALGYGSVFAGSSDTKLYALNARTGTVQWSATTGGIVSTPAVANGVVYVTSRDGSLGAYAATYGGLLFSGFGGFEFLGGPAISDGVLYVNGYTDAVSAYSLLAGTDVARAGVGAPAIPSLHPDLSLAITHYTQAARPPL